VVLGHNPYVMTPGQLRHTGDPVARYEPSIWSKHVSLYGPLATGEQWAAAELGGTSMARIVFWMKLWNMIAFGAVVLALERMLRSDPARRTRAHLLWTANPLLLWLLVAPGHVDLLAAAAGFLGLMLLRRREPAEEPGALRGLAAGALVGAAADIKINYLLFGLGGAWAVRRSPAALFAAAAGGPVRPGARARVPGGRPGGGPCAVRPQLPGLGGQLLPAVRRVTGTLRASPVRDIRGGVRRGRRADAVASPRRGPGPARGPARAG